MPDLKNLPRPDLLSKQAEAFLAFLAEGLADAMAPLEGLNQPVPPPSDHSRQATAKRIDWLGCMLRVANGDVDAAELVDGRLPRARNLRAATAGEARDVEALADLADRGPVSAYGPRRVLGSVPDLGGRNLEELEAEAEGRGVGALIPGPGKGGAA